MKEPYLVAPDEVRDEGPVAQSEVLVTLGPLLVTYLVVPDEVRDEGPVAQSEVLVTLGHLLVTRRARSLPFAFQIPAAKFPSRIGVAR